MKGLIIVLLFSSHLLFSQNNVAIFHANKSSVSVAATGGKAVSIAPFELINGMIVVKASINGVLGNFILDTGSPGIVINSTEHEGGSDYSATGVGGALAIGEININHFKWGIVEKDELKGFTIDISHLEKATGRQLAGLIGYEILEHYEVLFDYPNEIVKIYDGNNVAEFRKESPTIEVPFKMNGHIPMMEVQVGNKSAFLGLDSGAEVNLLDRSFFKSLNKSFLTDKNKEKVVGLDKDEQEVVAATLNSTKIEGHSMSAMKFLFLDLDGLSGQFDHDFDGLLGFPFFQQHTVAINYQEKKIYIWN
jgi:hypothetical protein